jgi:sugar-specific transcriptional regulator TrmB
VEKVSVNEEDIRLLNELGFTRSQARVYLTLLKIGETDARTLFKKANITQPEVYRALDELQEKGLVEKEITVPLKFIATPIHFGLQMLMSQKMQQCKETQKKMKEFLRKNQSCPIKKPPIQKHKLIMLEGKDRLTHAIKLEHSNVQRTVDIITTLQRWLQILDFNFQDYLEALDKKVKYRVVIAKPTGKITFPENIQALLAKPCFELRLSEKPLKINAAIFDENKATINFFEGKALMESPIIWTNHPGFIQMCQDRFDRLWKSAEKYKIQNENNL